MRIGVDLDDVVIDLQNAIVSFHNERYGTAFTRNDHRTFNLWEVWGCSREEAVGRIYEFFQSDWFFNVPPMMHAETGLHALAARGHELYAITDRTNDVVEETKKWIAQHFPETFQEIHFANHFTKSGPARKKSEICRELGITTLIDDSKDNAIDCAAAGIRVLLLDQPWNQGELPAGVERVFSWDEIVKKI